jgi:hypothetical protein
MTAGAAHAQTILNGYAGVGYTYSDTTDKEHYVTEGAGNYDYKDKITGFYVNGAASLPIVSIVGAQVDLGYGNITYSEDENYNNGASHYHYGYHGDTTTATGHVFARTDKWLAGGFVGQSDFLYGERLIGGGAEGQYYYGRWTFQGAVAYAKEADYVYSGSYPSVWSGRADVRYFLTDDLSFSGHAGYTDGSYHYGSSSEHGPKLWTVGVGGEYKIAKSPFTVTAEYEHGDATVNYNYSGGGYDHLKLSGDAFTFGVRWTFGGSLFDRDRHGASLNSFKDDVGGQFNNVASFGGFGA